MFLANYADVLTDAPLPDIIERFRATRRGRRLARGPAAVVAPRRRHPRRRHHHPDQGREANSTSGRTAATSCSGRASSMCSTPARIWSRMRCRRLVPDGRVMAYPHKGFWTAADTVKDRHPARRGLPPRRVPVDGVGPGAFRRTDSPTRSRCDAARFASAPTDRPLARSRPRAPIRTTSRSAPERRCCNSPALSAPRSALRRPDRHARCGTRRPARPRPPFCAGRRLTVDLHDLAEGRLPMQWGAGQGGSRGRRAGTSPRISFSRRRRVDAHQDHRTDRRDRADRLSQQPLPRLRDPEMGRRHLAPVSLCRRLPDEVARRKVELLSECFPSQHGRDWWDDEMFLGSRATAWHGVPGADTQRRSAARRRRSK